MNRRYFLKSLATGCSLQSLSGKFFAPHQALATVNTVRGAVPAEKLGVTLMHEHVLVDFIGADKVSRSRYRPAEVFRVALPFLKKIRSLGCRTLVDCTPAYLGRDPALLRQLSEASGLNLLTNTGCYGAADDKFVPRHAFRETPEQLSSRWVHEFQEGIENTGIKPGIIKIGVDRGSLSEIDAKLVRAAALTHLRTGLTIASHTGDGIAALDQLDLLKREGVASSVFIWVHAQNESDADTHLKAAEQGAFVEFDGIAEQSLDQHINFVKNMIQHGFLQQILISQDAGWYHVGEPGGGQFRNYEFLFSHFVPTLKKSGISEAQIRTLLISNPKRSLDPKIRKRAA